MFDVEAVRRDFPFLSRELGGRRVVYLDSAATSQKPRQVIDAVGACYSRFYANPHRGIHSLSVEATEAFEGARKKAASFLNAGASQEMIFTRGTTEAINLVAYSWGRANVGRGDAIVVSQMEHHSNLVPWQALAREKGAELRFIPVDVKTGVLDLGGLPELLDGAKLVALTHASNVLGTINGVKRVCVEAKKAGAASLVDGAQSAPHFPVDVRSIGCDFFACSSHKMLGPAGVGVLFGRRDLLEQMQPFNYGGDMIREVSFEESKWNDLPWKFEAGTGNIEGVVGFGAALDYLQSLGLDSVRAYEEELCKYAVLRLLEVEGLALYGPRDAALRTGALSFTLDGVHAHDVASILDSEGLCVRSGHHCAMPLARLLGVAATTRASLYLYNTRGEVDALVDGLVKARKMFL